MVLENITGYFQGVVNNLSLEGARLTLEPLMVFVIGMVIYSVFIFAFYRFISKRDMFKLSKEGRTTKHSKASYYLKYIFLFPIAAFLWFFMISIFLSMLSNVVTLSNIFMLSMAILISIRVTAYLHEDLSSDLAKMIPFALLGILLLDITSFSVDVPFNVLHQIPPEATTLIYYFVFIFVLELILRGLLSIVRSNKKQTKPSLPKTPKPTQLLK